MNIKVIGWTHNDNDKYPATELDSVEVRDAIVADIRANNYEFNGQDHHYHDSCTPVLSNGMRVCCSQRQWGDLMAYAHNIDDWDGNAYLFYFLADIENPQYPAKFVDDSAIVKEIPEPKKVAERRTEDEDYDEFEFRRFKLHNFSARRFKSDFKDCFALSASFDNNVALVAELLMEVEEKTNNQDIATRCVQTVTNIISHWLTEDGFKTKDECLSHLEKKFEGGRTKQSLSEYCPPDLKDAYHNFEGNLIPCLYFLLKNCPGDRAIKGRIKLHLHNLFEYSVLYQIETINSDIPQNVIEQAMDILKSVAN